MATSREESPTNTAGQQLTPGTRVRILQPPEYEVTLRSDTGTVLGPDEWEPYYVIRLDEPAEFRHADGSLEAITEICEAADNLVAITSALSNGPHDQPLAAQSRGRGRGTRS